LQIQDAKGQHTHAQQRNGAEHQTGAFKKNTEHELFSMDSR
jgi:hypothetical protein